MNWQPNETAPKDRTCVFLAVPGQLKGIFYYGAPAGSSCGPQWYCLDGRYWIENATHWMPLPKPPEVVLTEAQ